MNPYLNVLLWMLMLPSVVMAQGYGTLKGTVTNEQGEPLAGMTVAIDGTGFSAQTDAEGKYHMHGLPVGMYDVISARTEQWCDQDVFNVLIANGKTTRINFAVPPLSSHCDLIIYFYEPPLLPLDPFLGISWFNVEGGYYMNERFSLFR